MRVVDRTIEVQVPVTVVEHVEVATLPKGDQWAGALLDLAKQVEVGKVYDRDLPALAEAVDAVIAALSRRPALRRYR